MAVGARLARLGDRLCWSSGRAGRFRSGSRGFAAGRRLGQLVAKLRAAFFAAAQQTFVRFAVAGQEGDAHPAEDVIDHALGDANVGVLGVPHRLEAGVRELIHEHFQRHAVLQAHRNGRAEHVHQAADRAAFFGHVDEQLAGAAVVVQADGQVTFVPGHAELVRDRLARVGQAFARSIGVALAAALSPSVLVESGWLSLEPSR